jgi:hypothetical protein
MVLGILLLDSLVLAVAVVAGLAENLDQIMLLVQVVA